MGNCCKLPWYWTCKCYDDPLVCTNQDVIIVNGIEEKSSDHDYVGFETLEKVELNLSSTRSWTQEAIFGPTGFLKPHLGLVLENIKIYVHIKQQKITEEIYI